LWAFHTAASVVVVLASFLYVLFSTLPFIIHCSLFSFHSSPQAVENGAPVAAALDTISSPVDTTARVPLDDDIERFFHGKAGVPAILAGLREAQSGSEFAKKTLDKMVKLSPTSMCVTFEQIRRGREMGGDMDQVLAMEHGITQAIMREKGGDFYEGVRAVLVDKDGAPRWKYGIEEIEEVEAGVVEGYFGPAEKKWTKDDA